jgi:hypothetical protein
MDALTVQQALRGSAMALREVTRSVAWMREQRFNDVGVYSMFCAVLGEPMEAEDFDALMDRLKTELAHDGAARS